MSYPLAEREAAPLSNDELARLEQAASGLDASRLIWASGYLAGLAKFQAGTGATAAETTAAAVTLTVLYGSQTGNGQRLAERAAADAGALGMPVKLKSLADYRPAELRREQAVVLVVSTHGEGDPPDDAEPLYDYLMAERAPRLDKLSFAVLALGDSSYAKFCETGRQIDERLAELGAQRIAERAELDLDFETTAPPWFETTLAEARPLLAPVAQPRPQLRAVTAPSYDRARPFQAEVLVNQRITAGDSSKTVHHLELSLEGSGLRYEPGDSLGIVATNPPLLVAELLDVLGIEPQADVDGATVSERLREEFEITVASRSFVERYAHATASDALRALLADDARERLAGYLAERQIVDIVREHPAGIDAAAFCQCLRPLTPRLYSIASSQRQLPEEVAITVAEVRYEAFGRPHFGAASTHLVERLAVGDRVGVFVEPNQRFRLPADPAAPVIMIGPGTGVAPFRAFLTERAETGAAGDNWLFFGDRRFTQDFLYQLDWARFRKSGVLTRMDVAFSRDGERVYVQDRLREHGAELFAWLTRGAHVYVCGDASAMAPDVHAALVEIVSAESGRDSAAAEAYLKELRREGRYQRDVY